MQPVNEPLHVEAMTWAALLGRWLDFARASVALPKDAEGQRWRQSVAPIITLQAVTFALRQLDDLPEDARALGLDRGEILIHQESRRLNETWRGEAMPDLLLELMADTARMLRAATLGSAVELVVPDRPHDVRFAPQECRVTPAYGAGLREIDPNEFSGEIRLALPGTLLVPGEIMGFAIGRTPRAWRRERLNAPEALAQALPTLAEALAPFRARYVDSPRQAYRQMDEQGRIRRDVAAPLVDDPVPGQPLLYRVWMDGRVSLPEIDVPARAAQQRRAWPQGGSTFEEGNSGAVV